jgi:hypothetical protein
MSNFLEVTIYADKLGFVIACAKFKDFTADKYFNVNGKGNTVSCSLNDLSVLMKDRAGYRLYTVEKL